MPDKLSSAPIFEVGTSELEAAIEPFVRRGGGTRRRVLLPSIVESVFARAARLASSYPVLRLAYSVKTNPAPALLHAAHRSGFLAEVIGPQELDHARACGFGDEQLLYNGPYPAHECAHAPEVIFADSLEAFVAAAQRFPHSTVGIRLCPPGIYSRFGVAFARIDELSDVIRGARRSEIGISFHVRPQDYGGYDFHGLAEAVAGYGAELERRSGAVVSIFDAGGGKRPSAFDDEVRRGALDSLISLVRARLEHVRTIILEPGQALATSCEALIAPILEVRRSHDGVTEVVVDAGYPDVPQIRTFPHRIFQFSGDKPRLARPGGGRVLGHTCLEYDVLGEGIDLDGLRAGDSIAIADAGAYDASMSFQFARGRRCL